MRYSLHVLPVVLVSVVGCANGSPVDPGDSTTSTPAGFDTWLDEQCPNGAAVQVADHDGNNDHVAACESVREKALADPATRDRLVIAYLAQSEEKAEGGDGEPIGATGEALTPLGGLACALIALGPGLIFGWPGRGCEYAREPGDRRACEATTGGFSTGAGIFCAVAAFF